MDWKLGREEAVVLALVWKVISIDLVYSGTIDLPFLQRSGHTSFRWVANSERGNACCLVVFLLIIGDGSRNLCYICRVVGLVQAEQHNAADSSLVEKLQEFAHGFLR